MRTRLTSRLLAALLATAPLAVAVVPAHEARASAVADLSDEQLTDAATWIVRGKVAATWTEVDPTTDHVWTLTELSVSRVFKGPGNPETLIVHTLGGVYGDVDMQVLQAPRWSIGEDVVVFLDEISGGRLSTLGLYLGKYTVRRAPGDQYPHVLRFHGRPGERYDHRFLPNPPVGKRVYLDELIDRVETRLDAGWDGQPIPGVSRERLQKVNTLEWRRR